MRKIIFFCVTFLISYQMIALHAAESMGKKMVYEQKSITFKSGDNNLKGILFTPKKPNGKFITLMGPVAFVKEQSPLLYAKTLATKGYTTLIYDPTYYGESEGTPRGFENGKQKTRDIIASVNYLKTLTQTKSFDVYGVGICQGVNWMINASNEDARIKGISLVAGHYLSPTVAKLYNGGQKHLSTVLEKAQQAKDEFEKTGKIDYIPIVGTVKENALLTAPFVFDWYHPWDNNTNKKGGHWKNRITRMSLLEIWQGNVEKHIKKLQTPVMLIHSNKAASGAEEPKRLFAVIPAKNKDLVWFEDQSQIMFYDDQTTIDRAVDHIDGWFSKI